MKHLLSCYDSIARRTTYFLPMILFGILLSTTSIVKAQTGKALHFDGMDDYISLPVALSGDYTKEAWINPSTTTGFPNLLSGTGTALFISNGQLVAGHATGGYGQVMDPATILPGTWYHVAVTYNATTGAMKLYKDGVMVSSNSSVPSYTEFSLNISRFSGSNYFTGLVDEVRLWKTEKTVAQILASRDCELTGDEPGLLAYYNFNQGVAGGNNSGQTTLEDNYDNCLKSPGTLNNFELSNNTSNWVGASPTFTGTCSNSFANINIFGNGQCLNSGDNSPSVADNTNFGNVTVMPIKRRFTIINTGSAILNIGSIDISGTGASNFALTQQPAGSLTMGDSTSFEISFIPGGTLGVKNATITVNNDDADEALFNFDVAGNVAEQGRALSFDGINDRVDIPLAFTGSYTKEAWINTQSLSAFPNLITGNNTTGTALFLANGRLAAGHAPNFNQVQDATPLVAGTWYHVAVTYDAITGEMNLYKDAILVATASAAPSYSETYLQLGTYAGANFFNGSMDEVRIWNVVKSAADLLAAKNCELSGSEPGLLAYYNFNTGAAGLDNTGLTTLNDLHGTCPVNGTLVNFALDGTVSNWVTPGGDLTGSCTAQVSNISVSGNSLCIETGDNTPSSTDFTDFGLIAINTDLRRTFVITNNGGALLDINDISISGADASSFVIETAADAAVFPGFSTSFVIRFSPVTPGVKSATVTVVNSDTDEVLYNFSIQGDAFGTLPVTMLYFKAAASGNTSLLTWETTLENQNTGFEIQRSVAGAAGWEAIGFVRSTNLASGSRYNFTDLAPLKGNNAYRLKQTDVDGNYNFSQVKTVNFKADISNVNVYPNPVSDVLKFVFNDVKLLNTYATIRTATGANVRTILLTNLQQTADVSSLSNGVYFISFANGKVLRIIKK